MTCRHAHADGRQLVLCRSWMKSVAMLMHSEDNNAQLAAVSAVDAMHTHIDPTALPAYLQSLPAADSSALQKIIQRRSKPPAAGQQPSEPHDDKAASAPALQVTGSQQQADPGAAAATCTPAASSPVSMLPPAVGTQGQHTSAPGTPLKDMSNVPSQQHVPVQLRLQDYATILSPATAAASSAPSSPASLWSPAGPQEPSDQQRSQYDCAEVLSICC